MKMSLKDSLKTSKELLAGSGNGFIESSPPPLERLLYEAKRRSEVAATKPKDTGVVNIHGKEYLTVARRVQDFHEQKLGRITTELVSNEGSVVIMKCVILNAEGAVIATGYAEEDRTKGQINRTSALENAETSAVGRALAFLGLGGTEIASADEVAQAIQQKKGVMGAIMPDVKSDDAKALKAAEKLDRLFHLEGEGRNAQLELAASEEELNQALEWINSQGHDFKIAVWNKLGSKVRTYISSMEKGQ